jgi:hypothetical protein
MYLRPRSKPESERRWAQRRTQKWHRAEATTTTPSTAGGGGWAVKGFYVGSMGLTLTTTPINALRRSSKSWSAKLRRRRRQRAWL